MVVRTFLVMKQHKPPFSSLAEQLFIQRNAKEPLRAKWRGQTDLNGSLQIHALESVAYVLQFREGKWIV